MIFQKDIISAELVLESGERFKGYFFGSEKPVSGEVVFNTGMVGYPETMTDPSYTGQILAFTFPLIGNYGIPDSESLFDNKNFESDKVWVSGLIVSEFADNFEHWNALNSLSDWMKENNVPGIYGVDTRRLTKLLREKGTVLGKIIIGENEPELYDPNSDDLISKVCRKTISKYGGGKRKVLLFDTGCKNNIINELTNRDTEVTIIPWYEDFNGEEFDGIVLSNGPGNPEMYGQFVNKVKPLIFSKPVLGICLGHQMISLAAGAETFKLKYGHRSQNQPVIDNLTGKCYVTSQNHGYAVKTDTLPDGWEPRFTNLNDDTNEGLRHKELPVISVQFHPEAAPGPVDTSYIFDEFIERIDERKSK